MENEMKLIVVEVDLGLNFWNYTEEDLFQLQVDYCKSKSLPLFCNKTTNIGNPIGKYLVNQMGFNRAKEYLSTILITGCPETGRSWCD